MYTDLSQKLGRPATDEEISEAMGGNIEDFHALVDQLHGLTIGSFENLSDSEDSETPYPPLLSSIRRLGMRTSLPWRRNGSNSGMSHAD